MNNKLPNTLVDKQEGGTCWYYTIWHGLFHSNLGRQMITKVIHETKNKTISNNSSCPYAKTVTKSQLVGIAERYMRTGIKNVKNNLHKFTNRKSVSLNSGGSVQDMETVYHKLFGPEGSYYRIVSYEKLDKKWNYVRQNINKNKGNLKLSHAFISLRDGKFSGSHALSGVIKNNGRPIVIDSIGSIFDIDWTTKAGQTELADILQYSSIIITAVYIDPVYVSKSGPVIYRPNFIGKKLAPSGLVGTILQKNAESNYGTKMKILRMDLNQHIFNNQFLGNGGDKLFEQFVIKKLRNLSKAEIMKNPKYKNLNATKIRWENAVAVENRYKKYNNGSYVPVYNKIKNFLNKELENRSKPISINNLNQFSYK
jgi:hypothetical protein